MTYKQQVREDVALICAITASGGVRFGSFWSLSYQDIAAALDLCGCWGSCAASRLAYAARVAVYRAPRAQGFISNVDAEAEALLRTGWPRRTP